MHTIYDIFESKAHIPQGPKSAKDAPQFLQEILIVVPASSQKKMNLTLIQPRRIDKAAFVLT